MKKYLSKDVITPLCVLVFLIAYVLEAMSNSAPIIDSVPQESFFPLIIFIIGILADLMLLISALKAVGAGNSDKEKASINYKPFYVMIAIALFVFLFSIVGFLITAPLFVFTMMMIYDDKPQQIKRKIIFTILITAVVYVLYTYVFDINFPEIWR